MEGMGEMDNAPMPPMGADDMGMEDPMAGADPNAMGGEDSNMMGNDQPMGNGEDDELMNVIDGLSVEDKAAVLKYAKSMTDDSEGAEMPQDGGMGEMPMESRKSLKSIIDETINDVLDGEKKGTKRDEKELPKEYNGLKSPFRSPF